MQPDTSIPREPQRRQQMGFLYLPPYRVQGVSIAGEETCVQVPELDVAFDIGMVPRPALACKYVALSHGHMDHSAGISYYYSQRNFQGMGTGTILCPTAIAPAIHNVMKAWIDLESQRTPYEVIAMEPEQEVEIKNHIHLRAFETKHTVPSLGYVAIERRSKLKPELAGLPQEKLIERKNAGETITMTLEVPLVCYTGDTMWGPHFDRADVLGAKILIVECTFVEPGDAHRAAVGQHLHLNDIARLVEKSTAEAIVLTHLSRRTHLGQVKRQIEEVIPAKDQGRVFILMDGRANRARLDEQRGPVPGPEEE
ncbi:MAG: MBL fold metallo-hydrolase [Phycisphaeraceae bacterium]